MNKLFSKAKAVLHEHTNSNNDNFPLPSQGSSTVQPPTPLDVLRYRYHHGTNLGSIFVLEQWLHGSMFPANCPGTGSEHDAVKESIKQSGVEATRQKWENHWNSAISDNDFEWLVNEARCTSIRLPVGYFTLGTEFCKDTQFEDIKDVYVNAWTAVRKLVARARSWGIGVLLDFHALPGGANGESHSGTSTGKAELWGKRRYLDCATRCITFMARDIREGRLDGIIGLQLVNEASWDAKGMYDWYASTINIVSKIDSSIPIYISDGWDLERALKWSNGRRGKGPGNPVIIDTHKYYTFSESDRSQTPQQIIARVPNELNELNDKEGSIWDRGEAQIIIGEWSCVLDGQTWSRVRAEEKDDLVRQFGMAQSWKWSERTGGSYFWTYKMDWMPGGEWGFTSQTQQNNITSPDFLKLPHQETTQLFQSALNQKDQLLNQALASHTEYWDRTSPGTQFQHHLYGLGYDLGFSDALAFFVMRGEGGFGEKVREVGGGDKIGCLEVWVGKRLREFMSGERSDGERELGWEWEQGFRAGVKGFYGCVGI